jgi:hypothetical protein
MCLKIFFKVQAAKLNQALRVASTVVML